MIRVSPYGKDAHQIWLLLSSFSLGCVISIHPRRYIDSLLFTPHENEGSVASSDRVVILVKVAVAPPAVAAAAAVVVGVSGSKPEAHEVTPELKNYTWYCTCMQYDIFYIHRTDVIYYGLSWITKFTVYSLWVQIWNTARSICKLIISHTPFYPFHFTFSLAFFDMQMWF